MESGRYSDLVKAGLLIPHTEVDIAPADPVPAFKVIEPERIPFISISGFNALIATLKEQIHDELCGWFDRVLPIDIR